MLSVVDVEISSIDIEIHTHLLLLKFKTVAQLKPLKKSTTHNSCRGLRACRFAHGKKSLVFKTQNSIC
jgi:hypothetical protein